jgi:dTDP-4-amino-4,6-dideoxygalactose transaminase
VAHWTVPLADVVVPEEDIAAVADVYRSGWLSMGPCTEELESRLAQYTGARHALAVANCTVGLHLMCVAAGLGPGDEVVVPSLTFVASANAIRYTGAEPVFAEISGLDAPWLSAAAAEAAISERTKAIMTVAYGGHPGAVAELEALARRRDLLLLEDAAHAAGTRMSGRHAGTFGNAGGFSFFSNKNLAVGEGGAVVTNDDDLAARMRLLRSHGMTTLSWDRHRGHASRYDVVELGFNYRIDEPRARLATCRLERLDAENARRQRLVEHYHEALEAVPEVIAALPASEPEAVLAQHLFVVVLRPELDRDAFRAALHDHGVQTSLHYPPVHRFSIYGSGAAQLPLTDAYSERAVTLPLFAHMTDGQLETVITAVRSAASGNRRASISRTAAP